MKIHIPLRGQKVNYAQDGKAGKATLIIFCISYQWATQCACAMYIKTEHLTVRAENVKRKETFKKHLI